jgi:hypothetical protein
VACHGRDHIMILAGKSCLPARRRALKKGPSSQPPI